MFETEERKEKQLSCDEIDTLRLKIGCFLFAQGKYSKLEENHTLNKSSFLNIFQSKIGNYRGAFKLKSRVKTRQVRESLYQQLEHKSKKGGRNQVSVS